jgi:hypothetical protein
MKAAGWTVRLLLCTYLSTENVPFGSATATKVDGVQGADQENKSARPDADRPLGAAVAVSAAAAADAASAESRNSTALYSQETDSLWKDDWDDAYIPRSYSHPEPESNATDSDVVEPTVPASSASHGRPSRPYPTSGMVVLGMFAASGVALICG